QRDEHGERRFPKQPAQIGLSHEDSFKVPGLCVKSSLAARRERLYGVADLMAARASFTNLSSTPPPTSTGDAPRGSMFVMPFARATRPTSARRPAFTCAARPPRAA